MKTLFRLLLLTFLLSGLNASAVLMRPLSVQELTTNADLVLDGTVLSKVCLRDESGEICTKVQFKVTEVWKGTLATNEITIVHSGGTVGNQRLEVSGQVDYEVGEETVVFLKLNPHGEGVTIGLLQGKFHISQDDATGEKVAQNPFHGRSLTATNTTGATQLKLASPKKGRLTIADLKSEVQSQGGGK